MELTALQIISRAYRSLGVLGAGQTASGELADDALEILNEMVDAWNAERPMLFTSTRTVKALTANDATYTIGSGADIDITRPLWIDEARIIPDNSLASALQTELPCAVLSLEQWTSKVLKNFTSTYPHELFYDKGHDSNERGIITFWPVLTGANVSAVLYTPTALTAFAAPATAYKFARAYPQALRTNLAVLLAPEVGKEVPIAIERQAVMTKALIETYNARPPILTCDPGIAGRGGYDIRSGQIR